MKNATAVFLVLFISSLVCADASGATFTVDSILDEVDATPGDGICSAGGHCTLRAAIMEANASEEADIITLPAGTYTLTIPGAGEDACATGDLDITSDITIQGAGDASTTVNGGAIDRVFHIHPPAVVSMSDLTVSNGQESGGGGIRNDATLQMHGIVVTNNTVSGVGGGIYNAIGATLGAVGCAISDNTASSANSGDGGGIYNSGSATLDTCVVHGNTAKFSGGGVYNVNGILTMTNVVVSGNASVFGGGGLNNAGGATLTMGRCAVSGNTSTTSGAALSNLQTAQVVMANITISGNFASGGLYNTSTGPVSLTNVTIASNSGYGIRNFGTLLDVANSVFAQTSPNCDAGALLFISLGNNLSSDNSCAASLTDVTDFNNVNPLLGPLAYNGSSLQTHALLIGSPAIDTGGGCTATDQRGVVRPLDGNGDRNFVCDMGAYEFRKDKIGTFRAGKWPVDYSGNGIWNSTPADSLFTFGLAADRPATGDWDGDGRIEIGVFRNGMWVVDMNGNGAWDPVTDVIYTFGLAADKPVAGDWNGDGITEIGVFRNGTWVFDINGNGAWNPGVDEVLTFGLATDIPVTGDWNGDGVTDIGAFRSGNWYLDFNGNGVWDGCGTTDDKDRCYAFGLASDIPTSGDWNGDGITEIGVFRNVTWVLDMNGNGAWNPGTDAVYTFGLATDKPVTGNW